MSDGNIQAARVKLDKAVTRLCRPRYGIYLDVTHEAPSLYDQLKSDIAGRQGDNRTPAKSLPPIWIDAAQLLNAIDTTVRRWHPRPKIGTTKALIALSDRTWRPQDYEIVSTMAHTVNGWSEQIISLVDPQSVKHISAPCPSCGKSTVHRKDQAGEIVRQPALRVLTNTGCTCQACSAHWSPDRYLFLCKLLGFELPEGVLE